MHKSIENQRFNLQPEQNLKEQNKEIALAVESLYQASLTKDEDRTTKELGKIVKSAFKLFQDELINESGEQNIPKKDTSPQFFKALSTMNKLAQIYNNFRDRAVRPGYYTSDGQYRSNNISTCDISNMAREAIYRSLSGLDEKIIEQLDTFNTNDFFESIKLVLTHRSDVGIEWAVNFLDKNQGLFDQISEQKGLPDIKNQFNQLRDFLKTREFERSLVNAVQKGTETRQGAEVKFCENMLKELLTKYGLNPDECLDSWTWGSNLALQSNMEAVFKLEDQREGAARLLYKEFNIRNFERYPEPILTAQFDEFDNTEKPYGIMIQATHDYSNAFSNPTEKRDLQKFFDQIKAKYGLRIAEASSAQGVARRLISLNQKYGTYHKIAFAIGVGHGHKDFILLGSSDKERVNRQLLTKKNVAGTGGKRLANEFFEPNPPIVLFSCSTGIEDGIGQELSRVFDTKLTAPNIPVSFADIEPIITDMGIDFEVKFTATPPHKQENVEQIYSKGIKISSDFVP